MITTTTIAIIIVIHNHRNNTEWHIGTIEDIYLSGWLQDFRFNTFKSGQNKTKNAMSFCNAIQHFGLPENCQVSMAENEQFIRCLMSSYDLIGFTYIILF